MNDILCGLRREVVVYRPTLCEVECARWAISISNASFMESGKMGGEVNTSLRLSSPGRAYSSFASY